MLLGGAGQLAKGLELVDGQLPAAEPVVAEAEQLAHRRGGGCGVGHRLQELLGLFVAAPTARPTGVAQLCPPPPDLARSDSPRQRWVVFSRVLVSRHAVPLSRGPPAPAR